MGKRDVRNVITKYDVRTLFKSPFEKTTIKNHFETTEKLEVVIVLCYERKCPVFKNSQ